MLIEKGTHLIPDVVPHLLQIRSLLWLPTEHEIPATIRRQQSVIVLERLGRDHLVRLLGEMVRMRDVPLRPGRAYREPP